MIRRAFLVAAVFVLSHSPASSQTKFYHYYDAGLEYIEKRDWLRAIEELRSAASLEFEDADMKRIYGTRFIEYFPHRELGVAYYNLKEYETARKELQLSIGYASTSRAEEFLRLATRKVPPAEAEKARKDAEEAENRRDAEDTGHQQQEPVTHPETETFVPPAGLTYDPSRVRQVGARLTLAVMPFQGNGGSRDYVDPVTDRMVTQLVALRRFRVIERAKLDDVLQEQRLQVSGIVDDGTAVQIGRVAGADAIVVGNVSLIGSTANVGARVIDTESSEVLVARNARSEDTGLEDVERLVDLVATMIFNDLPLLQGSVITTDGNAMYIDLGSERRIRRGSRCVAYREVGDLRDPTSGVVIDKKVKMLGEVQVVDVLEKASKVELVRMEPGEMIRPGDRIVAK